MKHEFSVEKISTSQMPSAPDGNLFVRLTLVGVMSQEIANRVADVWLKKNPVEVLELMSTTGHILTIDFKGDEDGR